MKRQSGTNVLITGASDGIGFELLLLFSREGAHVIGTGTRPASALPVSWPANARYIQADQAHFDVANILLNAAGAAGWDAIDHLVLNAATGFVSAAEDEKPEAIAKTLAINLVAPMAITHGLAHMLFACRGLVTLIGSSAHKGAPGFASYAASKAGLGGFARALRSEWQERADVQILHPGPTATAMHAKAGSIPGFARRFFIQPDECARRIRRHIDQRTARANICIGLREVMSGLAGIGRQ